MVKQVGKLPTDVNFARRLNYWNFKYEIFHTNLTAFLVGLCIKTVHQLSFSFEETRKRLRRDAVKEDKEDIRETTERLGDAKEISADVSVAAILSKLECILILKEEQITASKFFLGGSDGSKVPLATVFMWITTHTNRKPRTVATCLN